MIMSDFGFFIKPAFIASLKQVISDNSAYLFEEAALKSTEQINILELFRLFVDLSLNFSRRELFPHPEGALIAVNLVSERPSKTSVKKSSYSFITKSLPTKSFGLEGL